MAHIYSNNDVNITTERVDQYEHKVNVNGNNLIWISADDVDDFKKELTELLDRYRI